MEGDSEITARHWDTGWKRFLVLSPREARGLVHVSRCEERVIQRIV